MSNIITPERYISKGMAGVRDYLADILMSETGGKRLLSLEEHLNSHIYIRDELSQIIQFKPNPVQLKHMARKKELKSKRILLLKARRMGFTTLEQAMSYSLIRTTRNIDTVTLAQDKETTTRIFRMVRLMHDLDSTSPALGVDSKSELSYPSMGSSFYIGTAGSKTFGRSATLRKVHGSEVAFWDMQDDLIDNLVVGLSEAARQGEMVLETTANGARGWFYEKYVEAVQGKNSWTPLFYSWFEDPRNAVDLLEGEADSIIETLTEEEADLVRLYDCGLEQLVWRRAKMRELKKKFAQEYPASWEEAFLVSGTTFFETDTIHRLLSSCKEAIRENENLTVWHEPREGLDYIIGMDASGGGEGGDFSVACVLCRETGEQVARLQGKWRPEVFARKAAELGKKYNKALLAPEENNHGHSVINTLINTLGYKRIYYHLDNTKRDAVRDKKPGWQTNAKTRPVLLDELSEAMEEGFMRVNDRLFLAQCKIFVDNGSGKYEAAKGAGKHDDLVIGWGIAWQARKQKKKGAIIK